jgi:hypothetical protein
MPKGKTGKPRGRPSRAVSVKLSACQEWARFQKANPSESYLDKIEGFCESKDYSASSLYRWLKWFRRRRGLDFFANVTETKPIVSGFIANG